jgi:hypothetical protein
MTFPIRQPAVGFLFARVPVCSCISSSIRLRIGVGGDRSAGRCCRCCVAHAFNLSFAPDDIALMSASTVCIWVGHKSLLVFLYSPLYTLFLAAHECTNAMGRGTDLLSTHDEYKCMVLDNSHSLHVT